MALKPTKAARIEQLLRVWQADNPAFFWAPTRPENFLKDQQRGLVGRVTPGLGVTYGGLQNTIKNGPGYIEFPSNFGLGTNSEFFCMLLVDIVDPQAVTGCFLKFGGTDVAGSGVGGGDTTFEDTGSKLIALKESIDWVRGVNNSFVAGLNVINFFRTSTPALGATNITTNSDASTGIANYNAPSAQLTVNGQGGTRGSNVTVCAVAIWPYAYDNATTVTKRNALAAPLVGLARQNRKPWFTPRYLLTANGAAGGTTGTLATTNANDTLAASGNQTNTGNLASTNANDTLAASGNLANTGTLAATNANDTLAASGNQTNTGTLAKTNGNDTLAGTGNLVNTGTLAATNANDTLSAAGSSGNDVIGTLATTNANDILAASGNQTNTGTLATTNTNDSLAASGNQTNTGTSSTTNANDILAATGAAGTITGEANITEGRDTLSASGTATTPSTSVGGGGAGGGKREILHARRRKPVKSADEELKELLDGVIEGVISPAKPVVQVTPKPTKEPVSLAKALASSIPSNITLTPAPVLRTEKQLLAEEEKAEMEALLHYFY